MAHEIIIEGILLDQNQQYTLTELCEICVVEQGLIKEMVAYGIIEPIDPAQAQWKFHAVDIQRSRKALRLYQDLAINWAGISLALDLLDQINELEMRTKILTAKLKS